MSTANEEPDDQPTVDPRVARNAALDELTTEQLPSIAGGVSWIFGLVSIPLLFLSPAAVITGFLAIVFGHVSKSRIKNRPEVGGDAAATGGLLMGYLCFFAALALLPMTRVQAVATRGIVESIRGVTGAAAGSKFEKAERSFLDTSAAASGNTKAAREIATELATLVNERKKEAFDSTSRHSIRILCQAGKEGLCTIAVVPDFAEFDSLARDGLLNLIWKSAQQAAHERIDAGELFAVVVRDRRRYYSMEFGRATISADKIAQPDSSFIDMTMIEPYFEQAKSDESGAPDKDNNPQEPGE